VTCFKGDLLPAIRLVLHGHVSQLVPKRQLQETGLVTQPSEVSRVGIYGVDELFGISAVCAGLPDCKHLCTSHTCQVAELELETLIEPPISVHPSYGQHLQDSRYSAQGTW